MTRRRKDEDLSLDFLAEMERQEEAWNLELLTEGVVLNSPSEISDDGDAAWLKLQGATPLEFLAMVFRNPFNEMNHRVNAAKSILDFVHRKLPQRIEVDGTMKDTRRITADSLSKLSDEEIEVFTKLLDKMGG